jgi:hypothetical protein
MQNVWRIGRNYETVARFVNALFRPLRSQQPDLDFTSNHKIILGFRMKITGSHDVLFGMKQVDAFAADS